MFKENPQSVLDKEKISQVLMEEWKRRNATPKAENQTMSAIENTEVEWRPEQGKPKKWVHPYLWFVKMRKRDLMKASPDLSFKDMMMHVSQTWKELSEAEKKIYEGMAQNDKLRHDR